MHCVSYIADLEGVIARDLVLHRQVITLGIRGLQVVVLTGGMLRRRVRLALNLTRSR